MKIRTLLLVFAISFFSFSFVSAQLVILSGPDGGSYHTFVNDMASNLSNDELVLKNHSTDGAAMNFQLLADPETPYKVSMMQMDYLNHMKAADSRDNTNITESIKVIVPLASEEIHLVTTQKKYIKDIKQLKDAVVAIGDKHQGTYVTANFIKDRSEIYWSSRNYHFDEALRNLKLDKIDAFFIVGTSPIEKLNLSPEVMVDQLALVPLKNFNGWADYYEALTISKDEYKWLEEDIPTFGVPNVLVVNEAKLTAEDRLMIEKLISSLENNLPKLKENGHPKWEEVNLESWDPAVWPLFK